MKILAMFAAALLFGLAGAVCARAAAPPAHDTQAAPQLDRAL
jgi:hypothetical protein